MSRYFDAIADAVYKRWILETGCRLTIEFLPKLYFTFGGFAMRCYYRIHSCIACALKRIVSSALLAKIKQADSTLSDDHLWFACPKLCPWVDQLVLVVCLSTDLSLLLKSTEIGVPNTEMRTKTSIFERVAVKGWKVGRKRRRFYSVICPATMERASIFP